MTQPATGPAVLATVKARLKIPDTNDDVVLTSIINAVNARVKGLPVAVLDGEAEESWPANVVEGANMLAVRLFRRKDSPAGVEAFSGDLALYVQRNDPDIGFLLKLGPHATPLVG